MPEARVKELYVDLQKEIHGCKDIQVSADPARLVPSRSEGGPLRRRKARTCDCFHKTK